MHIMSNVSTQSCIEKYSELKNLKLVGNALQIPWQTVYSKLKKAGVAVVGDKARYGSVTDRLAVFAEQSFKKYVPIAIDNNCLKYQASIDFYVGNCTVDVKAAVLQAAGRTAKGKSFSERWAYCISKQKDVADFFVLYAYTDTEKDRELSHVFLLPREIAINSSTISIPLTLKSKWADYEILESDLLGFFQEYIGDTKDSFEEMVDKGTDVWADVPNATKWVEDLRGNEQSNRDRSRKDNRSCYSDRR